jgi:hypothetical protein
MMGRGCLVWNWLAHISPPPSPQGTRELKPLRVLAKAFLAQLFIDISVEVPLFINSMHF